MNAREILTQLGIGHFNATSMIQDLFIAPSTSDPRSPQIILIVRQLQAKLQAMGAPILISGRIDRPTTNVLVRLMGKHVLGMPWASVIQGVLDAEAAGTDLSPRKAVPLPDPVPPLSGVGGILDAPFGLPDVPGGLVTYGVVGYFLYKHFKKRG